MIPFGNRSVTLLHKTADGYQAVALTGCSWQDAAAQTMGDKSVTRTAETTCRIPAGQQKPAPGDLLVLGEAEVAARNEVELIRLREARPARQRQQPDGPLAPLRGQRGVMQCEYPHRAGIVSRQRGAGQGEGHERPGLLDVCGDAVASAV